MGLIALGINYRLAPISVREKFSFEIESVRRILSDLVQQSKAEEAVLLSTCHRTEFYCELNGTNDPEPIFNLLEGRDQSYQLYKPSHPYIYSYTGEQAVKHVMRVASGLDSMVLGEVQILGQLKTAFRAASEVGTIGKYLGRLFQCTFSVAKEIRSRTEISKNPVSLGYAAAKLAGRIFSDLNEVNVLLLGAGEIINLTAKHLQKLGVKQWTVANRTFSRGEQLAKKLGGEAISLKELSNHLSKFDIIIAGLGASSPVLHQKEVLQALKYRKHKPIFMVDLAVPRNIESCVGDLEDVYLYCIDDLHGLVEEHRLARQEAAKMAEQIIEVKTSQFMEWLQAESSFETLCAFREKHLKFKDKELKIALQKLQSGCDAEKIIKQLAHKLTQSMLHTPTVKLREAGLKGNVEMLNQVAELFEL